MTYSCTLPRFSAKDFNANVDRFFADVLGGLTAAQTARRAAHVVPVNAWGDENALVLEMELPGVTADAIELSIHEGELTVTAKRPEQEVPEGATFYRRERPSGEYRRTFTLPADIDTEKVQAEMNAGVLRVTLPKVEVAKPRKIDVASKD